MRTSWPILTVVSVLVAAGFALAETPGHSRRKRADADEETSPTPTPKKKSAASPTPNENSPRKKTVRASPIPNEDASPTPTRKKKRSSASPTPNEEEPSPTPRHAKTSPSPTPETTSEPDEKPSRASNATLSTDEIAGFEKQPEKIQALIKSALALTTQNLTYTYGSADPASGGMDCSGFVYYVLRENGWKEVPRSSSEQYVWVRKAGKFFAVLSRKNETFELEDLEPGDLMFWTGTYSVDHDPPITHAMIYLGIEKRTKKRVMVGSSDGRSYDGKQRWGVSVFDFQNATKASADGGGPRFVGYGRIPGLRE